MIIRDNVHGSIRFSAFEQRIIDCAAFQRLRRVKQIAFTYLVYPGATHTRFEHSLGTAHIAGQIARRLEWDADRVEKVRATALLHDIGHTAFSHDGERALAGRLPNHEKLGEKIIRESELRDILQERFRLHDVLSIEKKPEGRLIASDLGADRMDYLLRDARATGVAYGIVEIDRISQRLHFHRGALCIDEGGLEAAESLLIARFMMFSTVYLHRTVRIASAMLRRAIRVALDDGIVVPEDFLAYSDEEMLLRMRAGRARSWVDRLLARRLYKEAYTLSPARRSWTALEENLSKKYQCEVLVDVPYDFFKPVDIRVQTGGKLRPLLSLSPLVKHLEHSEIQRQKVLVLCPPEKRGRIQNHRKEWQG